MCSNIRFLTANTFMPVIFLIAYPFTAIVMYMLLSRSRNHLCSENLTAYRTAISSYTVFCFRRRDCNCTLILYMSRQVVLFTADTFMPMIGIIAHPVTAKHMAFHSTNNLTAFCFRRNHRAVGSRYSGCIAAGFSHCEGTRRFSFQ